jgi:hypothetical protein
MPGQAKPTVLARAATALVDLRAALSGLHAATGCHVFLYAHRGRLRSDKWRRLRFTRGLAGKFRSDLTNQLIAKLPPNRDLTAFSFDEMTGQHIGVIEKSEFDAIRIWLNDVPTPDWPHLFDGSAPFFSKVRFHVTTIAADGHTKILKVFRQRSNSSLLHKGGLMAIFNSASHEFTETGGSVFDFSLDIDFFEWDDFVFILHLGSFESLTNMRQITLTRAQDAISGLRFVEHLEVVGLDDVALRLQDRPYMAKKLAAAERQGTIDALKAETLLARIEQKGLPLVTETKGEEHRIIVDTSVPDQVNEFINLVTDVYLQSPVTSKEYKVHVKEPV